MAREPPPQPARAVRLPVVWVVIAGVHLVAAAYAWRLLPHGFTWRHPRFWVNEVFPIGLASAGVVCLCGIWRGWTRVAALAIGVFPGVHLGMAVAWQVVFPITGGRVALVAGGAACVLCACAFASLRGLCGARWPVAIGVAVGLAAGGVVPWSQRGADPATHPAGAPRELGHPAATASPPAALPPWAHVFPEIAALRVETATVQLDLQPLLQFISRSPDRGWTALAGARDRIGPLRRYEGATGDGATSTYYYSGAERALLHVSSPGDDVLSVEALTVLPAPVYSHLNTFCALEITGHHHLFVAFSPIPAQPIEVTYSEYPTGRPSRFAYLDAASVLHVVQATSGEKGPFHELASGRLPPSGALALTLFDDQQPVARIELADFAAQASTQVSPTAGWGVPENAIELSLSQDRPDAPAFVYITLAGTSVGRGWDSVGHAPGLYRDRIEIRRLSPSAGTSSRTPAAAPDRSARPAAAAP